MQTPKLINLLSTFSFLFFLFLTVTSHALPEDKNKPIYLSADSADLNQSTHQGEYIGHVDFKQGTSHITAERAITLVDENNKLTKAVAYGNDKTRAHFSTMTDQQKPKMHARAKIIRYYPLKHLIELEGHAQVTQGNDRFEADIIKYDTIKQHVISNNKGTGRTLIVINSDKIK